jgi:hypothetical protein
MTAPSPNPFTVPLPSEDRPAAFGASSGKFSAKRRALTYRQHFAAAWQGFVRENFETPEHAAVVFGVDASTARKWFEGSHAPSGFAVGYAYALAPEAAAQRLGG